MSVIKTVNLTKVYKDVIAVDNLNLEIIEGELFSLLGVNGAGKTTTIKMLTGLVEATNGDALIYGKSINKDMSSIKPFIDVSMQETAIARKLTVEENIDFYGSINGLSKEQITKVKESLYKSFDLGKVAKKQASKLSGGWQRKLSIALALVSNPKVLFLDEPTLGLDVLARRELWKIINSFLMLEKSFYIYFLLHVWKKKDVAESKKGTLILGKIEENL